MYVSNLSRPQICWLIGSIIIAVAIIVLGVALEPAKEDVSVPSFSLEMSIKKIAPQLDVSGMSLARELDLPLKTSKTDSLEKLGIDQDQLDHAVEHIMSHRPTMLKYYVYAAIVLWGFVFLTKLGRPEGLPISQRKSWFPRTGYLIAILIAVIACGFLLGKSPNPMEGIVKVFKAMVGLYPSVLKRSSH